MKLTIIIPVYNEIKTIQKIVERVKRQKYIKKQIILVDDSSTDGTTELIKLELFKQVDKVIFHKKNQGKGASIHSALKFANGEFVIIQDADLEYNPNDYKILLNAITKYNCMAIYGSRLMDKKNINKFISNNRIHINKILSFITNILYKIKLTDAHTCYKLINKNIMLSLNLKEKDFAFCPEVTAKLAKKNIKIKEVPISFNGRTRLEGKKISFFDGIRALLVLLKYRFVS